MEVSGQLEAPAVLLSGKEPPLPIAYEDRWVPEPVRTWWPRENKSLHSLPQPGIEPLQTKIQKRYCVVL
jgi:hypothetical protein